MAHRSIVESQTAQIALISNSTIWQQATTFYSLFLCLFGNVVHRLICQDVIAPSQVDSANEYVKKILVREHSPIRSTSPFGWPHRPGFAGNRVDEFKVKWLAQSVPQFNNGFVAAIGTRCYE